MKRIVCLLLITINIFCAYANEEQIFDQKIALLELSIGSMNSFKYAFGDVGRARLIKELERTGYEGVVLDLLRCDSSLEFNYETSTYPLLEAFVQLGYPKYKVNETLAQEIAELVALQMPLYSRVQPP